MSCTPSEAEYPFHWIPIHTHRQETHMLPDTLPSSNLPRWLRKLSTESARRDVTLRTVMQRGIIQRQLIPMIHCGNKGVAQRGSEQTVHLSLECCLGSVWGHLPWLASGDSPQELCLTAGPSCRSSVFTFAWRWNISHAALTVILTGQTWPSLSTVCYTT